VPPGPRSRSGGGPCPASPPRPVPGRPARAGRPAAAQRSSSSSWLSSCWSWSSGALRTSTLDRRLRRPALFSPPGARRSASTCWPSCRCSALIVVLLALVLLVLVLRGPAHQHGGQALAAAGALLRLEFETEHVHLGAGDRHPSGGLGQQSADAVDVVVVELE